MKSSYVYQEGMRVKSAKIYPIAEKGSHRDLLVLDCSYAWFLELPVSENNLDNYTVCVSGYNKDFKSLFGVETHKGLVDAFLMEYRRYDAMDAFLERIRGKHVFKVNDFRLDSSATKLDRFIYRCAQKRYNVPLEYFMCWYRGISKHLLAAGLPEDNVMDLFRKHKIELGFIRAHGNGLTPEHLAKRMLEKPSAPKVYDEYAKSKNRVTGKKIAEYRRELEQEYRKYLPNEIFGEDFIQHECYGVSDVIIAGYIRQQSPPSDVAYYSTF